VARASGAQELLRHEGLRADEHTALAAGNAQDANSTAVLAKVDATLSSNKALAEKFGVKGYPTLKVIRDHAADAASDYGGPRDAAGIASYVTKLSGPATTELTSAEEVAAFAAKDSVVVVRAVCMRAVRPACALNVRTRARRSASFLAPAYPTSSRRRRRCCVTRILLAT
jgi:thiol-disulfide isomerase/thioredoxin